MLAEDRGGEGRVEAAVPEEAEQVGAALGEEAGADGFGGAFPVGRGAVAPAGALGDQAVADLGHAGVEPGEIAGRGEGAVVEEVAVDAVGEEDLEVRVAFGEEGAEEAAGAAVGGGVEVEGGGAEEAVGIGQPELEAGAGVDRAGAAVLGLRVPVEPDEHEVDEVGDVEAALDGEVGAAVGADAFPGGAVFGIRGAVDEIIAGIVVAADDQVVVIRPAEVAGEEVVVEAFVGVVLAPVGAVDVDVDEAAVGVEAAHFEHGVLDEAAGHGEAAFDHVVVAGGEVEGVDFVEGGHAAVEAAEERGFEAVGAVFRAEADAVAFLGELGVGAAEAGEAGIDLERRRAVGEEDFDRGGAFQVVVGQDRDAEADGGDGAEAAAEAGGERALGVGGVHEGRAHDAVAEEVAVGGDGRRVVAGAAGGGADAAVGGDRDRAGVGERGFGAVERVEDLRGGVGVAEDEGEGVVVEAAGVAEGGRGEPAGEGVGQVVGAGAGREEGEAAIEGAAVGEVVGLGRVVRDGIDDGAIGRGEDDRLAG